MEPPNRPQNINRLMAAVVQEQDADRAVAALSRLGLHATRLSTIGGFLQRGNVTLLIGMNEAQLGSAVRAFRQSCRRRVEYIAAPVEGSPLPFPSSIPVPVGGATLFTFDVERYEEL